MKTPPKAKSDELRRALLCLTRCQKQFTESELPPDWLRWVAESLLEGVPKDEPPKEDK